ncbi:MAG: BrnT family toxin [Fuscovulum sp.]|nr:MAG: BrnT family toxin [Fuscovulum sp.]
MWDWDEAKRQTNRDKHGIDFAALAQFDWTTAQIEPDNRRDYGEDRFIAVGYIKDRLHKLIFTKRNGRVRVISFRKANRREQRKWASRNI